MTKLTLKELKYKQESIRRKRRFDKYPWLRHYYRCRGRCVCKADISYKYYGAKKIQLMATKEDIGEQWLGDRAYNLKDPVLSRKDHSKHYTKDNICFIERAENTAEMNRRTKSRKVRQMDNLGNELRVWFSMADVGRALGITKQHIYHCCRGQRKTAGGYRWQYV